MTAQKNLLQNADFSAIENGLPIGWRTWSSRETLAPIFSVDSVVKRSGSASLKIAGGGNQYCFGRWFQRVPITGGKSYRLKVVFRFEGFEDVNLHLLNIVLWGRGNRAWSNCPQDHIASYRLDNDWVVGEQVFKAPDDADDAEVQLLIRFAADGVVWWDSVELVEAEPLLKREIKVVGGRWTPPSPSNPERNREFWAGILEAAGQLRTDLVCLPEAMNTASIHKPMAELAEHIPGPTFDMLSAKATEYGMYVCGCLYEWDSDFIFNTAVLIDRQGQMVGKYRKVHPYWPEEPDGCSPGDEFPVFKTDFGTVGIIICYDSWWGETTRLLALKGADIVLFPNAGYEPKLMPARAIDNNVYMLVASLGSPGMIVDTDGNILRQTNEPGIVSTTVDLNYRPNPAPNSGGSLNQSPGGCRGTRNSMSLRLYEEILAEIARWEDLDFVSSVSNF